VSAQPNITTIFRPEAVYYIGFGSFDEGEPLGEVEIAGGMPLLFPQNTRSVLATLRRDNSWSIKATSRRKRKTAPKKTARRR
jgi:hypothetical protein